jgi:hypothetical protein
MTFCQNTANQLFTTVIPLRGKSELWAEAFSRSKKRVDFVYIDASHEYADVADDIANWTPIVHPGGILAGHDFGIFPGVTKAVTESGPFAQIGHSVWWRFVK